MENSKIEWCDHTFNPWIGCCKISEGCKNCYAEKIAKRFYKQAQWGKNEKRILTSDSYWKQPLKWNRKAGAENKRKKIFCASMADVFDESVSDSWRDRIFSLVKDTQNLDWLILTKRPENALHYFNYNTIKGNLIPWNAWIGVTVENQKEANERIPLLLKIQASMRFLSCEPLLSEINFYETSGFMPEKNHPWRNVPILTGIDWVICGGETGRDARPCHPHWIRKIKEQCIHSNVAFFFKQWGEYMPLTNEIKPENINSIRFFNMNMERDKSSFPFYSAWKMNGAKNNILDGREWNQFPLTNNREECL